MHYRSNRSVPWFATAGVASTLLFGGVAHAATTDLFALSGLITNPGTYDLTRLQALPAVTQTDTFTSAGTPVTTDFTGVPLYTLLTSPLAGGGIVTTPGVKNDFLRDYVVATGSDGYRVVVSEGEIDPNFGNTQDLVAYQANGQPLGNNGFARTTAPGDIAGGRYVSNVASLDVFSATSTSQIQGIGGGISQSFALAGQIVNPRAFNLTDLQALPQTSQHVTYQAGSTTVSGTFTGVSLWTLLTSIQAGQGILTNPNIKNDLLGKFLVATGSDGYKAVIALGEIAPNFGNKAYMIATDFTPDGGSDPGSLGSDGFARLVATGDIKGGRYVSNLVGLEILNAPPTAVPVPGAAVLFATGLGGLVWRRFRITA
jgi:hypothetical protein